MNIQKEASKALELDFSIRPRLADYASSFNRVSGGINYLRFDNCVRSNFLLILILKLEHNLMVRIETWENIIVADAIGTVRNSGSAFNII